MDTAKFIEEFQDYLAPKLDTYEQAIYLYVFRHSRLQGKSEVTIGFKSSRRKMSTGIGDKGKPMAEGTCYEKLRSLEAKGCISIVGTVRDGTRVLLKLPSEIPGVIAAVVSKKQPSMEEMDFFNVPENRALILQREKSLCFYCLRTIDSSNYVIEHVQSRPQGDNSYRNVVAACRSCNNRKGKTPADEFLRILYRNSFLTETEFQDRLNALRLLRQGHLKPLAL